MAKAKGPVKNPDGTYNRNSGVRFGGRPATVCPVTRTEFTEHAKPLICVIKEAGSEGGATPVTVVLGNREFSTGSLGWHGGEKVTLAIDVPMPDGSVKKTAVRCQLNFSLTLIGSKELPGAEGQEGGEDGAK